MVSITFFVFVALILVVGFFAATWRRKNRVPLDPDGQPERNVRTPDPNDRPIESKGNIKGGILPADNRLSQDHVEDNEPLK